MPGNADIFTDYPLTRLLAYTHMSNLAHLVLVENPPQHPAGDFTLQHGDQSLMVSNQAGQTRTFSGISVMHPDFLAAVQPQPTPLLPSLNHAIDHGMVTGEFYAGLWDDIGTPDRLEALRNRLSQ